MALALVGGAAIGALFGALYDVVKESMDRTVLQYKPLLGDLKFTLESLRPRIVQQIGDHNVELGLPNDDIESLQRQMEEGIVLVRKLSNIGMWNCYAWGSCCNCTKPSYGDQLVDLDRSLRILLEILKLQEARDVKEVLFLARKIHDKQDELERRMSDLLKVQQEAGDVGGSSGSNTGTTIQQGNEGNGGHQVAPIGRVGGAATLGAVFGVLFDTIARVKDKTMMLKRPLEDVKSTLDSLKPLIEEIATYNKVLNLPKEELENVRFQMEEGVELLHKCSKVRQWTSYKRYEYANKLLGLDESLQGLLNILRVQLARDVRESLVSVSKIEKVIDQIEESGTLQLQNHPTEIEDSCDVLEPPQPEVGLSVQGTRDVKETLDSAAKIEVGVKRIEGSGDVQGQTDMGIGEPKLPTLEAPDVENEVTEYVPSTVTVGLDVLLRELKRELLKDEVSALVLTGPRGCGKTKLAKKICQDKEVKDIFKNSIFFVRVSKRPNLSVIVRKLYQQIEHKGSQIPELQEDTIALKWLQVFLKETGQHPSLLVLDDVWPGSEPILDKFDNFKTSNYKILVTSRSEFPTFGSPYYLQSIYDEGTMTLSHHSRAYSFESLDDEDLVCVSPAPSFTAMDDDPTTYFRDFSTSYLEDKISHVSENANPMAHFHDSSASTARDRSSYVSRDVGTKFPLGNPVKSTQTYMQQKLELKVSADDKTMKKVMKAVSAIKGVSSISWDAKNQKLTVVGQLDPALIAIKLRKIVSKTEQVIKDTIILFGPLGTACSILRELISGQGTRHLRTDERN
ncbi:hypothetical protein L3X38_028685 [Prunus dulcis]|uniref:RPW8 domain-containing protein n=1 Tax=Prunus dulcis TaxID=3755 RepID=A0AAD4Z2A6_PRUDU|nr:hypothetical protein L3X38_028685 [Prunus dulcis]